ncbi:MAG: efflux RND transporter periplasmic adaptor subunit [Sphingobacterium sp.]|jgi:cobalt-zinc-cadmium efflux system membrane fusion protein|nr:efflux RND transporter periplasmic adaptor subunit [Sphingobacterium sp.]
MNKTIRIIVYGGLTLFSFISCTQGEKAENKPTAAPTDSSQLDQNIQLDAKQLSAAGIVVGTPTVENISGKITLQGTVAVAPQNTVSLSFPIGGYIKSTSMLPGKPVRKGQVLATIEDLQFIQLQQDYLTAQTNYTLAETEYKRQYELNQSKASSDKVFQQAKAEMDRERILISSLAEKLRLIGIVPQKLTTTNIKKEVPIVSPSDGFITKVNISVGKYTAPTDILFEIVNPSAMYLSLKVFEKDLSKIQVGSTVTAYANSDVDRKIPAAVFLVNRTFDENRMAEVLCHFRQSASILTPGMFMNADLNVDNTKALVVPEEAVVRWQNKYFVFVQQTAGIFKMNEVKLGVQDNGKQQIITENIHPDTVVALKNAFALLMKAQNKAE